jgi:hypothetical protein
MPLPGQSDQGVASSSNVWNVIDVKENCRLFNHVVSCLTWHNGACGHSQRKITLLSLNSKCLYSTMQGTQCSNLNGEKFLHGGRQFIHSPSFMVIPWETIQCHLSKFSFSKQPYDLHFSVWMDLSTNRELFVYLIDLDSWQRQNFHYNEYRNIVWLDTIRAHNCLKCIIISSDQQ